MRRIAATPRSNWEKRVEEVGLAFHHTPEGLYWDETAYYLFSVREIEDLERATNDLHQLCLAAVQHVIDTERFSELGIPAAVVPLIQETWESEPPSIYGRFDLAYDGKSSPKLLEYNADTPTALLEASVVQWFWLQDRFRTRDQFNSIHERLLAKWTELKDYLDHSPLCFTCAAGSAEDRVTIGYLQDTASQAGIQTSMILIEDIGWDPRWQRFVDLDENPVGSIFKLYPWEWLIQESFGAFLLQTHRRMQWIEPVWKLALSSKGLLPILWELNPGHPNLLEAHFSERAQTSDTVRKPLFSREGANIRIRRSNGNCMETGGTYGAEGFIHQRWTPLPCIDGRYPVIGSWVIDGESAGIGIRESGSPITDNTSRFVPHLFE